VCDPCGNSDVFGGRGAPDWAAKSRSGGEDAERPAATATAAVAANGC